MKMETKCVHGCNNIESHAGAISYPIYQSATFRHPALNQSTGYDYSRDLNPTREQVEKTIAVLEGGSRGFAFASGMAAISVFLGLFSPGDHLIVSDDLYGGTYRLFEQQKRYGLQFTYLDTADLNQVREALRPETKCIFIETPSNPTMKVTDIAGIAALAKEAGALTAVDNTFLTPYFQRPLELGADFVIHSGTKYLGGHNDTLAGFLVVQDDVLAKELKLLQMSMGSMLAPFDSWLILRGIKTLGIRMEKSQANAQRIASWLKGHPSVDKVYYPGFPDHAGYEISARQASGFGAMLSFTVKDAELVERILREVKVISFAESLGGVESLITFPLVQTHAAIPKDILERIGVNHRLLRLSVGIEAGEDIISDLERAMR